MALFEPLFDALNRDGVRYVVVGMAKRPDWTAGFDDARAFQRERVLAATPAQRLAWLEEAIALAYRTGALPRPVPDDE